MREKSADLGLRYLGAICSLFSVYTGDEGEIKCHNAGARINNSFFDNFISIYNFFCAFVCFCCYEN